MSTQRTIVILAASTALVLSATMAASAHAHLVRATPAAGGTVQVAPSEVTLRFSEKLEPKFSSVVVRDSAGNEFKGQVLLRGNYWGHSFVTVAFQAQDVPALGYKVYAIDQAPTGVPGEGAKFAVESDEPCPVLVRQAQKVGVRDLLASENSLKHPD